MGSGNEDLMSPDELSRIEVATLNQLEERLSRVGKMLGQCEDLVSHYRHSAPDMCELSTARVLAASSALQLSVALEEFEKLLEHRERPEKGRW
jgi:hypothetical protein